MAEPRPGPPSALSGPQCSQLLPPSLGGLIPPSYFVLRPRSLGAELAVKKGCGHELEAELKALREQSQGLEVALEAERRRSHVLEAELAAERGRSQRLEAERSRSHALEVELEAERGRSQILEMELEALRRRGLGPEGSEPSPEQVLLSRWRQKVFQLLLQVRLHQGQELQLQGQLRSLGAAVAARSHQVSLLELRLRRGEQELQGERQALSQERLRAEAAEEELGKLGQALRRYWGDWDVPVNVPTPVPIVVPLDVPADVPVAVPRLLGTLGVALANVTEAVVALGTLSERLGRARHRLWALVALGWLRWQRQLEGTAGDSGAMAPEMTLEQLRGWHRGDTGNTGGGSVPKVPPPYPPEGRDGTRLRLGTVSLAPLVMQLQALGAAILRDIRDPTVPPPRGDSSDIIREL
ncbi:coiled-coil alpha-helical rod protein 1-like isoform X2 [Sylvia atricapilla]|uniref:coiled-coil alpha-helical rod protein 1-like isoform X2 n=1 Tax=Sylvia atricapilla TaxID=48155 RepID=UPI00339AEF0A